METSRCNPAPTEETAAAIIAALEHWATDVSPVTDQAPQLMLTPWKRTALAEGVAPFI